MEVVIMVLFYIVYFTIIFGVIGASTAFYILQALGLSAIARRRGMDKPWLAWIPVAGTWLLGAVADRHLEAKDGKDLQLRKVLLVAIGAVYACLTVFWLCYFGLFFSAFLTGITEAEAFTVICLILFYICFILVTVVMSAASMVNSVVTYLCCYFIYESCDPDKKVLYLILSILLGPAIFIFLCRNKGLDGECPADALLPPEEDSAPLAQ